MLLFLQVAPFVLFPSSLPRREFEKSVRLQPILNELTHKVAHDEAFLRETLVETIKVDKFTRKLFEIYDSVWQDDKTQVMEISTLALFPLSSCSFTIFRDYLLIELINYHPYYHLVNLTILLERSIWFPNIYTSSFIS